MKSILDCTPEELKKIIEQNALLPDVNLAGIEANKDFQKLFRFRSSPASLAGVLLKEKTKATSSEDSGLKEKRLELKTKELELKELKIKSLSHQMKELFKKVNDVEKKIDHLIFIVSENRFEENSKGEIK